MSISTWMGSTSLSAPTLIQGPIYDGFSGSGGLTGRTTDAGGGSYVLNQYTGTAREAFIVGSSRVISNLTSNPQEVFGYIERSADRMWVRRQVDTDAASGVATSQRPIADHVTIGTGVANWMYLNSSSTTGTVSDVGLRSTTAANIQTNLGTNSNFAQILAGDQLTVRYEGLLGGAPTARGYVNGQAITDAIAWNTTTNPVTHRYGFRGSTACSFGEFWVISPVNDRSIELICPGRTVQQNSNGDVQMKLTFRAYPDMPSAANLRYSFIDAATGTPVTGHNEQPISNLVVSPSVGILETSEAANVATCFTGTMASASVPATFRVQLKRLDVTGGSVSIALSPILRRGNVVVFGGQSLSQQMWAAVGTAGSGVSATAPTNHFCFDATNQYGTADLDISTGGNYPRVRTQRRNTTTDAGPTNQFAGVLQALTAGRPVMMGLSGWGGTLQAARNNLVTNPTFRERLLIGLANAHYKHAYFIDTSGQFELDDPTNTANGGPYYNSFREAIDGRVSPFTAGYEAQLMIEQDAIDGMCGASVRMLCPVNVLGSTDANQQEFRRLQAITIPANRPGRVVRGPYLAACYRSNQVNNTTFDKYHLSPTTYTTLGHTNSGYGMQARRMARRVAHLLDPVSNPSDFNGPRMISAVRASATTIDVTFDPNGGTLNVRNTGYLPSIGAAADWRCGLDFLTVADSTDFNPANALFPTNATVVGNVVTFTFGATLPTTIYVCAARGSFPFARNPTSYARYDGVGGTGGTDAIHLDMTLRASMVCSDYTGSEFNGRGTTTEWVEVQPYWNTGGANGTDYLTAS